MWVTEECFFKLPTTLYIGRCTLLKKEFRAKKLAIIPHFDSIIVQLN